jgi:hypothetical protein
MVPLSEVRRLLGDENDAVKSMIATIDEVIEGERHE